MFTIDELSIIRLYAGEGHNRAAALEDLKACLPFLDDTSTWRLVSNLIEKLMTMNDAEFAKLDFSETLASIP